MAWRGSLTIMLDCCRGEVTVVDLVNESMIEGVVESVDSEGNMEMKNAILTKANGEQDVFSVFFVQGRKIRYVHLPEDVDAASLLENAVEKKVSARFPSGKGRSMSKKMAKSQALRKKVKDALEASQKSTEKDTVQQR
eukprot:scpid88228/ scgid22341/ U7 snRNA-associated Sm-like protein LSm10